jgi:hypothetical protein
MKQRRKSGVYGYDRYLYEPAGVALGLTGFSVFIKYPANIAALAEGAVEATKFFRQDNIMVGGTALNLT